jgi:hypothetical protein
MENIAEITLADKFFLSDNDITRLSEYASDRFRELIAELHRKTGEKEK